MGYVGQGSSELMLGSLLWRLEGWETRDREERRKGRGRWKCDSIRLEIVRSGYFLARVPYALYYTAWSSIGSSDAADHARLVHVCLGVYEPNDHSTTRFLCKGDVRPCDVLP